MNHHVVHVQAVHDAFGTDRIMITFSDLFCIDSLIPSIDNPWCSTVFINKPDIFDFLLLSTLKSTCVTRLY